MEGRKQGRERRLRTFTVKAVWGRGPIGDDDLWPSQLTLQPSQLAPGPVSWYVGSSVRPWVHTASVAIV